MPAFVEVMEQAIEDSIDGGIVGKAADGPSSPSDFPEDSLNGIGGSDFDVMFWRAIEEAQELFQVFFQARDGFGSFSSPVGSPAMELLECVATRAGLINLFGFGQAGCLDFPREFIGDISEFMDPAPLTRDSREDNLQSLMQAFAAIGDDELGLLTGESSMEKIL